MNVLTCKKCGGDLEISGSHLVCSKCGESFWLQSAETTKTQAGIAPYEKSEYGTGVNNITASKRERNLLPKILGYCGLIAVVATIIGIIIAASPKHKIEKILRENNLDGVKVVETCKLGDDIKGLDGDNTLVLLKGKSSGLSKYAIGIVDIKKESLKEPAYGYNPLNIIMVKIFKGSEKLNKDNFRITEKYLRKYGFDCFLNQEYAEEYLREITGRGGIMDTVVARQAITESISYIFPDNPSASDIEVLFEEGNANPAYYTTKSSELRYNWSFIFDESVYKVWKANTDRSTQETMVALYGQPYDLREVWAVVDRNLKPVGTFDSLDFVRKTFGEVSPLTKSNAADAKRETSGNTEKKSENTSTSANSTEVPEISFDSNNEYIFPSDRIKLTKEQLDGLTQDEVALLRNEIYARHGYVFSREKYKTYFAKKSWYKPNENFDESMFNSVEKENKDFIVKYETEKGWR